MGALKSFPLCLMVLTSVLVHLVISKPQSRIGPDGSEFYIEIDQRYNWFQAMHECARRCMQLVEIQSGDKNNIVMRVLDSLVGNSQNLWLGANDEYNIAENLNRPFYWTPSGRRMAYTYWARGQPQNSEGAEHCVHTWADVDNFRWNSANCTANYGFICEERT